MGIWPGSLQWFFVLYSKRQISRGRSSKDDDQGKMSASELGVGVFGSPEELSRKTCRSIALSRVVVGEVPPVFPGPCGTGPPSFQPAR